MPLVNVDPFLELFLLFRVCWIRGTLGGGKTLLAVALAEHLLKLAMVDGVVTNFPTVLPSALGDEDGTLIRRAVIFDEAWTHLDSRDSLVNPREYGAYARKIGSYWIIPSVHSIDKRLRSIIVWRSGRFTLPFLPEFWVYRYKLELEYDQCESFFILTSPKRYFGMYDTSYIPTSDGGIEGRYRRTLDTLTQGRGVAETDRLADYLRALSELGQLEVLGDVV